MFANFNSLFVLFRMKWSNIKGDVFGLSLDFWIFSTEMEKVNYFMSNLLGWRYHPGKVERAVSRNFEHNKRASSMCIFSNFWRKELMETATLLAELNDQLEGWIGVGVWKKSKNISFSLSERAKGCVKHNSFNSFCSTLLYLEENQRASGSHGWVSRK